MKHMRIANMQINVMRFFYNIIGAAANKQNRFLTEIQSESLPKLEIEAGK